MGLVDQLRDHARYCDAVGAPLYGVLMRAMADDLVAGGPVAEVLAGHLDADRADVVQLRLLAGLHRLVLTRRAPSLATWYPSVGGHGDPGSVWPVARAVIAAHVDELRADLQVAPQTNEPGRAAALAVGLLLAAARSGLGRVRLLELGASAGLNLLVDRFRVTAADDAWAWGPPGSPVDLSGTVHGGLDPRARGVAGAGGVEIVSRRGCDLTPVDPRTTQGRLRLTSFVWPDHEERRRRLTGALELAARVPAPVDAATAGEWLQARLAAPVEPDVLTVVWHSVVLQYVDARERAGIADVLAAARPRVPLVHLALESSTAPYDSRPQLTLDGLVVATTPAHGVPVTLAP